MELLLNCHHFIYRCHYQNLSNYMLFSKLVFSFLLFIEKSYLTKNRKIVVLPVSGVGWLEFFSFLIDL